MSAKSAIWPFLGFLFIGFAAFIVATTVVLALIPIYLQKNSAPSSSVSNKDLAFYAQYSSDLDADSEDTVTGDISNTAELAKSLGVSSDIDILSATAQSSFSRRRRDASGRRTKRGLVMNFLLRCAPKKSLTCFTPSCLEQVRSRSMLVMKDVTNKTGISFNITSSGSVRRSAFSLVFLGFVVTPSLAGFTGEMKTLEFVATQSGPFTNITTWTNGTMPYGNCSIIIPAGITVTLNRPIFELRMRQCDIFGTLIVGGGNTNFRFNFPSAINVHKGGNLLDASSEKKLFIPSNSVLMVYPGGSIGSSGTNFQIYTRRGNNIQANGSSAVIPTSGPYTCGVLRSGAVIAQNKILFIAVGIGSILRGSTFLGGIGPSAALCEAAGGCGLNIQPGATVQTDDLDDDFNINFDDITILDGATFTLGKPGSSKGIKFRYAFKMTCYGIMRFIGAAGDIMLPTGSKWDFLGNGVFRALMKIVLRSYNSATGVFLSLLELDPSYSGGFSITISTNGQLSRNDSVPTATGAPFG